MKTRGLCSASFRVSLREVCNCDASTAFRVSHYTLDFRYFLSRSFTCHTRKLHSDSDVSPASWYSSKIQDNQYLHYRAPLSFRHQKSSMHSLGTSDANVATKVCGTKFSIIMDTKELVDDLYRTITSTSMIMGLGGTHHECEVANARN